jgi:hypothetical protein
MPTFWQRPLTWLFLMATACLDAVALKRFWMSDFSDLLLMGQAIVVGAWLALSSAHRLARAGVALGLVLALSAHDFARERWMGSVVGEWQQVLGVYLCFVAVAAGASSLVVALIGRSHCEKERNASRWRISIAEILGWMVITAVGAATLPHARFAFLADPTSYIQIIALPVAAAALIVPYTSTGRPQSSIAKWIAVAAFLALAIVAGVLNVEELILCGIVLAYVACWITVQRLDARPQPTIRPLRLVAP